MCLRRALMMLLNLLDNLDNLCAWNLPQIKKERKKK